MKKLSVLALCLLYLVSLVGCAVSCKTKTVPPPTLSIQRKYSHLLTYLDPREKEPVSSCTATAVGPHALLTANHCDPLHVKGLVNLDLSTHEYHVLTGYFDDRDHVIIIVDGPPFVNFVPLRYRHAVLGEHVYTYAFGGDQYPAHRYDGKVIPEKNGGDASDVDAAAGIQSFSFAAIPGDSGAAIYGDDGVVVGVITYGRGKAEYSTGFELNFSEEILDLVAQ